MFVFGVQVDVFGDIFVSIVIIKIIFLFKKKVEIIVINDIIRFDVKNRYTKKYIKEFSKSGADIVKFLRSTSILT